MSCYNLVSVDSASLVLYHLFYFIYFLFSLLLFKNLNQNPFGTRLGFNFAFKNTISCGFELALAHHYIAHDSCACEYI
jgi:hypothetical protein